MILVLGTYWCWTFAVSGVEKLEVLASSSQRLAFGLRVAHAWRCPYDFYMRRKIFVLHIPHTYLDEMYAYSWCMACPQAPRLLIRFSRLGQSYLPIQSLFLGSILASCWLKVGGS